MRTLNRRRFLELGSVAGALGVTAPALAFNAAQRVRGDAAQDADDRVIRLSGDGVSSEDKNATHHKLN